MPEEVTYFHVSLFYNTTLVTDKFAFGLHNKITIIILMCFAAILTAFHYFGDPLMCSSGQVPTENLKARCWFVTVFIIHGQENPVLGSPLYNKDDQVQFYRYHLWACFILFLQASFFYVSGYLWKRWEGGLMHKLYVELETEDVATYWQLVANTLFRKFYTLNPYVYRFFFCKLLNLVNIIGQIYLLDYFLEGAFGKYGVKLLWLIFIKLIYRTDSLFRVFPKITRCMFYLTGKTGILKWSEVLCFMTLNMFSEKLFVFLFFWYMFVAVFTVYYFLYCILSFFSSSYRLSLLKRTSKLAFEEVVEAIYNKCKYGSWFVLCQLSKNIEPETFSQLLTDLMRKLYDK